MRPVKLCVLAFVTLMPLAAREEPMPDCLARSLDSKDQAPFFLCLNVRREGCEELLRKINAECGQDSAKYKLAFERYLAVRTRANLLMDTVSADLRAGHRGAGEAYTKAMLEVSEAVKLLEGSDKGLTCDGSPTRFLQFLVPLFTTAFTERVQEWLKGWMSGKKDEREARATELTSHRWKLPSELGVPFPGKPALAAGKEKDKAS